MAARKEFGLLCLENPLLGKISPTDDTISLIIYSGLSFTLEKLKGHAREYEIN